MTWFTGMADIRLARRSEYSTEAMQLAKSAIDEGWVKYKDEIGTDLNIPSVIFPPGVCNTTNANYFRNWPDRPAPTPTPTTKPLSPAPSLDETLIGVYDYKICTSSGATTIEGIGYYKGNKITLKGTVTHSDVAIMSTNPAPPPDEIQTGWNHDNDTLTIYQTGPSK